MRDQNEFMRQMLELVDLAKTQESRITKEQVKDFCCDLDLTAPQLKLVYDFLEEHNIDVTGHSSKKHSGKAVSQEAGFEAGDGQLQESDLNTEDSKYLRIYRRELRELPDLSGEEKEQLYGRLLSGDASVQHKVIESFLKRVVTLAGKYKNRGGSDPGGKSVFDHDGGHALRQSRHLRCKKRAGAQCKGAHDRAGGQPVRKPGAGKYDPGENKPDP